MVVIFSVALDVSKARCHERRDFCRWVTALKELLEWIRGFCFWETSEFKCGSEEIFHLRHRFFAVFVIFLLFLPCLISLPTAISCYQLDLSPTYQIDQVMLRCVSWIVFGSQYSRPNVKSSRQRCESMWSRRNAERRLVVEVCKYRCRFVCRAQIMITLLLSLTLGVLRTRKMTLIHTLFFLPKCLRIYDTYREIPVVLP